MCSTNGFHIAFWKIPPYFIFIGINKIKNLFLLKHESKFTFNYHIIGISLDSNSWVLISIIYFSFTSKAFIFKIYEMSRRFIKNRLLIKIGIRRTFHLPWISCIILFKYLPWTLKNTKKNSKIHIIWNNESTFNIILYALRNILYIFMNI